MELGQAGLNNRAVILNFQVIRSLNFNLLAHALLYLNQPLPQMQRCIFGGEVKNILGNEALSFWSRKLPNA